MKSTLSLRLAVMFLLLFTTLSACKIPSMPGGMSPNLPGGPSSGTQATAAPIAFDYYTPGEIATVLEGPVFLISPNFGKPESLMDSTGAGWLHLAEGAWRSNEMQALHAGDLHLLGAVMNLEHLNISQANPRPEMAALDIDLNPIPLTKPGMSGFLAGEYFYSIYDPRWQALLIEQGKGLIDAGAEGIIVDGPNSYGLLVTDAGGSFDEYSLSGFREYLRAKYAPAELSARFEIEDIDSFDFRQYLIDKGLHDTWNASDPTRLPITHEFFLFQNKGADDFLRRFAQEMQEYARSTYNRDFAFSFNASPQFDWSHFLSVDYLSYQTGENFYFTRSHLQASLVTKLAEGVIPGKMVFLAEVGHDRGDIPRQTQNLFKYIFADVYSSSGAGMIIPTDGIYTMRDGGYVQPFVTFDLAEAQRYVDFMTANPALFNQPEPARVAIVHSSPSEIGNLLPTTERLYSTNGDLVASMQILLNDRTPFDMLVSGDGTWATSVLTLDDLREYAVVILPSVDLISDAEVQALLDYVRGGGVVIELNNFGRHDATGVAVNRPQLNGLTNAPGAHSLGQGTWHTLHLWNELGSYFWDGDQNRTLLPTEHAADDPAFVALTTALDRYHQAEVTTDAPSTVVIRRYSDGTRWIVHLVNYGFDQTTDQYTPVGTFDIAIDLGGLSVTRAVLYDLEAGTVVEIPVTIASGKATVTIPALYAYSILELLP